MKKRMNSFFEKKASENSISEDSSFGKYFLGKSEELSALGVDNSFKLEMMKKAEIENDESTIKKLSFDYFSQRHHVDSVSEVETRWKNIYYKIKSQATNIPSAQNLAIKYSNDLDKDEAFRFLQWFKYYSNGEHKKYAGDKKMRIKKKADLHTGINSGGPYQINPSIDKRDFGNSMGYINDVKKNLNKEDPEEFLNKINLAYDEPELDVAEEEEEQDIMTEEQSASATKFKGSIGRGVRSILSNMMNVNSLPVETVERIMGLLNQLTIEAHKVKTAQTASSLVYKTANKLKRDGINYGVGQLEKLAQEVEQQAAAPVATAPTEVAPEQAGVADQTESVQSEEPSPKDGIPRSEEVQPVAFEDIETDGPEEGEYDKLIDEDINISDASRKLDQVAGMLADRRVIRNLAEFDIMLDKLGIASMFPELAESQSKLIDAFGYALTRVTKMMGQLSNAQTIISQSDKIPGSEEPEE